MKKETIIQFFGPDKKKIAIFTYSFVFSSIYQWIWYFTMAPQIHIFPILIYHGFPLSFFTTVASWGTALPPEPLPLGFFPINLVTDIIFWYLISCLVVSIYDRFRRKPTEDS